MELGSLNNEELQRLRIAYSADDLADILEIDKNILYTHLKRRNILAPPEYVRERLPLPVLADMIAKFGIHKVSKRYNVSESFLRGLFVHVKSMEADLTEPHQDLLNEALEKFKSPTVVSRMYGLPKSRLPEFKGSRLEETGRMKGGIGRSAELLILEMIGGKDMNEGDPRALYDIDHKEYGRINVKATLKQKGPWQVPTADNCDWVCFVVLHRDKKSLRYAALYHSDGITGVRPNNLQTPFHIIKEFEFSL